MAKRALVSHFTPVRSSHSKKVHGLSLSATERAVCGFKAKKGWVVIPAVEGLSEWEMLTCVRCKGACK